MPRSWASESAGPTREAISISHRHCWSDLLINTAPAQYFGTAGRTESCQIGMFAAYASTSHRALADRELYVPKSWAEERDRSRAAKVPDERGLCTKGELAKRLVLRALGPDPPIARVTADSACGQEGRFRRLL
jgi:SRSO17 transposase